MACATSPLRYPGGKTSLFPLLSTVLKANRLEHWPYAEPYAGGCGLALSLLYQGACQRLSDVSAFGTN